MRAVRRSILSKVSKAGSEERRTWSPCSPPKPEPRSWDSWVSREEKTRAGIKKPAEAPRAVFQARDPESCWETGVGVGWGGRDPNWDFSLDLLNLASTPRFN